METNPQILKDCCDAPAVGVAGRALCAGAEPNLPDKRPILLPLEIPDADVVAGRVAGYKRADRAQRGERVS
ncbi:MAG TPA: hypothetical protein VLM38_09360 [Blastocatellia bacterium]|nr:hypothetical protein [Blastocatellia bacterium]